MVRPGRSEWAGPDWIGLVETGLVWPPSLFERDTKHFTDTTTPTDQLRWRRRNSNSLGMDQGGGGE